jgi:hypothetical protein
MRDRNGGDVTWMAADITWGSAQRDRSASSALPHAAPGARGRPGMRAAMRYNRAMRRLLLCVFALTASLACDRDPRDAPAVKQLLPADARQIVENADVMTVYALNPDPLAAGEPRFQDYAIVSSQTVPKAGTRRQIATLLMAGVTEGGERAACFDPRHGVRATRGDSSIDLLICFECSQVRAHRGTVRTDAPTSSAAKSALDAVLAPSEPSTRRDG